jgi:hypothetical protein
MATQTRTPHDARAGPNRRLTTKTPHQPQTGPGRPPAARTRSHCGRVWSQRPHSPPRRPRPPRTILVSPSGVLDGRSSCMWHCGPTLLRSEQSPEWDDCSPSERSYAWRRSLRRARGEAFRGHRRGATARLGWCDLADERCENQRKHNYWSVGQVSR